MRKLKTTIVAVGFSLLMAVGIAYAGSGFCGFNIERVVLRGCVGETFRECTGTWQSVMRGDGEWECQYSENCVILGSCSDITGGDQ